MGVPNNYKYVIPQAIKPIVIPGVNDKISLTADDVMKMINGDDLEIAIMLCMSINAIATNIFRKFINGIKASQTQEGRERYCYERNYLAKVKGKQNTFKSVVTATERILDDFDKQISVLLKDSAKRCGESDSFEYACADCIDVVEEHFKPILDASNRYFVGELARMKDIPEDIWCYSDLLLVGLITEVNFEVYEFLFVNGEMNYVSNVDTYKFLNGIRLREQYVKLKNTIDLKASNGKDDAYYYVNILGKKDYSEIKKDMCRILFSIENVKKMFKARGNDIVFKEMGSMIDSFDDNTYSLNYYASHYKAAYPLDNIKRKKK